MCVYIYIYIQYYIQYIIYKLKCSFSWQDFLVCSGIDLKSWATYLRHSLISKFCASGAATDQICSFNGHDETIIYTTSFVTHHIICCYLAHDITIYLYGIFSTTRSILSPNINTTSSQLFDSTYYKRPIIQQTLTIFNKTSLFPVTSQ